MRKKTVSGNKSPMKTNSLSFNQLLFDIQRQPNAISASPYDMAWLAWLMPSARDWLLEAQHLDGSWGADLEYYHDRVIGTLAAINALAATSTNGHELLRIEHGIKYLERTTPRLSRDPTETVGFELLAPSLLATGQKLGLDLQQVALSLAPYEAIRRQKLALIPPAMLYSQTSSAPYSLEFLGFEDLDRAAVADLRFKNGSIHNSPAATAFCEIGGAGAPAGADYLSSTMEYYQGVVPTFAPSDIFEISWSLLHLSLAADLTQFHQATRPLMNILEDGWSTQGAGLTKEFPVDLDDTAAAYMLLSTLSEAPDPKVFEAFEEEDHFHCYQFERNISLDVHIHLVMALRQSPDFPRRDDMLLKAINILCRYLQSEYITDKWHVSPYYSTAHALIALIGLVNDSLIQDQIRWLCRTQRADGSWTFYPQFPAAALEETAHALLALLVVQRHNGSIADDIIRRGIDYLKLRYHYYQDLPALWIAKTVYRPLHIARAIFLAAFSLYEKLY
jgi:halimadienyl-diphosphate synthase